MAATSREYDQLLKSLYALEATKGMDFKLERVALALKNLGDPHHQFECIHVAGTNGKGSVAAMLHAIFLAAGYDVGLYTSPHLVSFTERVRIGRREIETDEVVRLAAEVRTASTAAAVELTFFEFTTVMAFLYFASRRVSLAVIETGLGGRLDATNVVDPRLAVITSIGMDHQEFLGDTLESIAREKGGIIKPGRPLIVGRVPADARRIIATIAAERGAPVQWFGEEFDVSSNGELCFRGGGMEIDNLVVGLRGRHQRENAAVALAAAVTVGSSYSLSPQAMRAGLAQVRWPGRLEVFGQQPLVLLDGAHNEDGIAALCRELPDVVRGRPLHLVFSVMRDKAWRPMVDRLAPLVASVVLTTASPRRAAPPEELADAFAQCCPVEIVHEPAAAYARAVQRAGSDGAVLVTGSLFLIGDIYSSVLRRSEEERLFDTAYPALHP